MYVYTHIKYVIYIILSNTERDLEASVSCSESADECTVLFVLRSPCDCIRDQILS